MCGRYALTMPTEAMAALFETDPPDWRWEGSANIAPTSAIPVVRLSPEGRRVLIQARWGLIPSWAKDAEIGKRLFNARAETVAEKPAFRAAFRRGRCLIPAEGFYEWQGEKGRKRAYLFRRRDGQPMALAGLAETWRDPESAAALPTATIVTTAANAEVAPIHERMPLVLEPAVWSAWLDPRLDADFARALLDPPAGGVLDVSLADPGALRRTG